jgi:hypothetical protein
MAGGHVGTSGQGQVTIKLEDETSSLGKKEIWFAHVEDDGLRKSRVSEPNFLSSWKGWLLETLGLVIVREGVWDSCGERTRGAFSFKEAWEIPGLKKDWFPMGWDATF